MNTVSFCPVPHYFYRKVSWLAPPNLRQRQSHHHSGASLGSGGGFAGCRTTGGGEVVAAVVGAIRKPLDAPGSGMPRKLATPVLAESPSSMTTELSAAEGMVGRKRTPSRGGDESSSSWTASWRTNRGLTASNWAFPLWAVHSKGVSTYMLILWV